jgi:NitT/TauT family transport system substrate-binding protein
MSEMRSVLKLLSVVMVLSVVLAGCGGGSTKKGVGVSEGSKPAAAATEAPAATKAAEPAKPVQAEVTVKLGSSERGSLKNLMFNLNSFGKDQAIKLDFKEYKGGTQIAQALTAGEVDMAVLAAEHVLGDTSGELRMVSMLTDVPANVLMVDSKYKDQIKSVKDLQGKKVSVSGIGGGSHKILLAILNKYGVDPSSVTVLPNGQDVTALFEKGEVAAVVSIEPFVTQAIENGKGFALVDTRKKSGVQEVFGVESIAWIALVTRKDFIEKNPEVVARTTAAVSQALQKIATSSAEELVAETPDYMFPGGDKSLYTKMLKENQGSFVADGKVTEKLLAPLWADMQAKGAAPKDKPLPFAQVVASAR